MGKSGIALERISWGGGVLNLRLPSNFEEVA